MLPLRFSLRSSLVVCVLATIGVSAGCPEDLLADAPCEEDENCPNDLVCGDEGICVDEDELGDDDDDDGEEGEGEGEEGEGEGEEGEGEGEGEEGEGEGGEGEGEGDGGEGEGEGGDDCSFGERTFNSDEALEEIRGCVTIEGELTVDGNNISSLGPFEDVQTVDGDIEFVDLGEVDGSEALGGIGEVTGDLSLTGDGAGEIGEALVGLTDVGSLFIIETSIVTLRGFASLESIESELFFGDNENLEGFGDGTFGSLGFIGDSVGAANNPSLPLCLLEALIDSVEGEPFLDDEGNNNEQFFCDG